MVDGINLQYFCCCFLDILNQREKLRKITHLPEDGVLSKETIYLLQETYGRVITLKEDSYKIFSSHMRYNIPSKETIMAKTSKPVLDEEYKDLKARFKCDIFADTFSDSIVIATPLLNSYKDILLFGVSGLFFTISNIFLISLAKGTILRGGIDVGIGGMIGQSEIYGPVLERAYSLESSISLYPRICVGNETVSMLKNFVELKAENQFDNINQNLASICLNYVFVDGDGNYSIDYLGKQTLELAKSDPSLIKSIREELIPKCVKSIDTQMEEAHKRKDTKVLLRYLALQEYIISRLPLWDLKVKRV